MLHRVVFVVALLLLVFTSACEKDMLKPGDYTPANAVRVPTINRADLVSEDGSCFVGYRNFKLRPEYVTFSWQSSIDTNFLSYKILRNDQVIKNIYERTTTSILDSLLIPNTSYKYSVVTQVRTGLSKYDTLTVKTASVLSPQVNFRVNSQNHVILTWLDRSDIPGSFEIIRDNVSIAVVNEIGQDNPAHVYSYTDTNVSQFSNHFYRIRKVGSMDQTPLSQLTNVYVNYQMVPPVLTNLTQLPGTQAVQLTWTENCSSETGFRVYRKLSNAAAFVVMATLNQSNITQYTDEFNLVLGNTYDYYVTAIDLDNTPLYETDPSNILSITITETPAFALWQIALIDSYGDGWNGATVRVLVNGNPVTGDLTLVTPAGPDYYQFQVFDGDLITTVYSPGSWANETYYAIINHNNQIVAQEGGTWNNPGISTPYSISVPIVVDLGEKQQPNLISISEVSK